MPRKKYVFKILSSPRHGGALDGMSLRVTHDMSVVPLLGVVLHILLNKDT